MMTSMLSGPAGVRGSTRETIRLTVSGLMRAEAWPALPGLGSTMTMGPPPAWWMPMKPGRLGPRQNRTSCPSRRRTMRTVLLLPPQER